MSYTNILIVMNSLWILNFIIVWNYICMPINLVLLKPVSQIKLCCFNSNTHDPIENSLFLIENPFFIGFLSNELYLVQLWNARRYKTWKFSHTYKFLTFDIFLHIRTEPNLIQCNVVKQFVNLFSIQKSRLVWKTKFLFYPDKKIVISRQNLWY